MDLKDIAKMQLKNQLIQQLSTGTVVITWTHQIEEVLLDVLVARQ